MNFNLLTDPWIPVRMSGNGRAETIGLLELFRTSAQISDLSVSTHERISLMRLLVCITQAALSAPAEADEWENWGDDLEEKTAAYLGKWRAHFDLFGDGQRFLQSPIKDTKDYPTAQIVYDLSTGNNPTLLDHVGDETRDFPAAFLARAILVYQNHFVGGSLASKVKGNGPALKALHSFLIGTTLRETILLNCIDLNTLGATQLGKPVWEGGLESDFLARFCPSPCKLWLVDEGRRIRIDQGRVYPEFEESGIREPSTTIITGKRKGTEVNVLLRASIGRGIWRDLHCLTVLSKEERKAPLSFLSHFTARHGPDVTFWSGELIKAKDAKIHDALDSRFTVPWQLFEETGRTRYQAGVGFAEFLESRLKAAVFIYGRTLKHENTPIETSRRHYWNTLDHKSNILLELLKGAGTENDPMGSVTFGKAADPWTLAVRRAAREAYDATCPRSTPRQLEAYAAGLKQFAPKSNKSKPATAQNQ